MIPKRVLVLLLASLTLSGCGERTEPLAAEVSSYPVSVRGAGDRPAVLGSRSERVVALDAGGAELVAAIGAADRLVGVPSDVFLEAPSVAVRVVGLSGQVDVDLVVELEPDLVIAAPAVDPRDVSRIQQEARTTLYVQPDRSLRDVQRAAAELGLLVGEPLAGRRVAESIRRAAGDVAARVGGREPRRTFLDTGFLITAPARSLLGDLLRRAGGESVAGPTPRSEAFAPCEIIDLRPEIILTTDSRTALRARFARAGCRAPDVEIVELPEDVGRAGPKVAQGLARIARALHPHAFA